MIQKSKQIRDVWRDWYSQDSYIFIKLGIEEISIESLFFI